MYGMETLRSDGQTVIYRFASLQSRDAWILAGKERVALDTDEELDGLEFSEWTRPGSGLPAGAILCAVVTPLSVPAEG